MGEIIIKNQTTLTDYAALIHAALYLADVHSDKDKFKVDVKDTITGKLVILIVEETE